jgi:hypothetical protein
MQERREHEQEKLPQDQEEVIPNASGLPAWAQQRLMQRQQERLQQQEKERRRKELEADGKKEDSPSAGDP